MDPSDEPRVTSVLARMGSLVLQQETVERLLDLVAELTERTVRSASAVSITLVRDRSAFTSHASEPVARKLDAAQYEAGEGPCLTAATTGELQNVSLHHDGDRWPQLSVSAREHGIASVLSVPLAVEEQRLGGINVYSPNAERFTDVEVATARLLAQQATAVLANAAAFVHASALNAQLREALESRDVIGQAKGVLMERESCGPDEAFDMLRRASQRTNRKLRDVAQDLVTAVVERTNR